MIRPKSPKSSDSKDIQRLVHQLETHQIELEIQNEELKDAHLKMEEMRDQYMELYNSSPCGHITLDHRGYILQANLTTATILGITRELIENQLFSKFINQDDQDVYYHDRKEIFNSHLRQSCELKVSDIYCKDTWIKLESVYIEENNTTRSMITNITNEKKAAENQRKLIVELMAAKDQANAANRAKSCFLSNMTHDLRTPLNSIMGMIEVLQRKDLDQQTKDTSLSSMGRASATLLETINDVLDLAKIELNKVVLNNCVFNIDEVIDTQNGLHRSKCEQKGIAFSIKIEKDVPKLLWGDVHYLQRVLSNLINNAIKFTIEGRIELNISKSDDKIIFEVHDTGIGIADENKEKIFEPFIQGDSTTTRKYGGSGLGISIVKELVKKLGGDFWLTSKQGIGSSFTFSFPIDKISNQNNERKAMHFIRESESSIKPMTILLAEDAEENRLLIELYLKDHPVKIEMAFNGKIAFELYQANPHKYDLILMDLQMPVMDGYRAAEMIRKFEKNNHIKRSIVIALSASVLENEVEKALSCGCDFHMSKPIKIAFLLDKLKDFTARGKENLIAQNTMFSVENTILDQQHNEIVDAVNDLHRTIESQASQSIISKKRHELIDQMTTHFATEESIFSISKYPDIKKHIKKHMDFAKKANIYQHEIELGNYTEKFLLYFIKSWMEQHISKLDMDFSYYIK